MNEPRKASSVLLAIGGALAMMIVCLIAAVLLLKLPFIAKHLPSVELTADDVQPVKSMPTLTATQPAPVVQTTGVDCAGLSEVLTFRLESAQGCLDDLQCGLSVPRQRCLIGISVGLRAPLEDAVLEFTAQCNRPLPALDALCRTPDREWQPVCERNQCVLREVDSPW